MEALSLALDMAGIDAQRALYLRNTIYTVKPLPRFLLLLVKHPSVCQSSPAPASLAFACVSSSLNTVLEHFITIYSTTPLFLLTGEEKQKATETSSKL